MGIKNKKKVVLWKKEAVKTKRKIENECNNKNNYESFVKPKNNWRKAFT